MIDCHVHIEKGPYNLNWLEKFIEQGLKENISELYILEHTHRFSEFLPLYSQMSQYNDYQHAWIMKKGRHSIYDYIHLIELAKQQKYPITIKYGLEVCYEETKEDFINEIRQLYQWDFFTGSIHWVDGFAYDHKKEFWNKKNINTLYIRYYTLVTKLIKSSLFTGLGHPDAIKCFGFYPDISLTEFYCTISHLLNSNNMYAEDNAGLYNNYSHDEIGLGEQLRKIFVLNKVKILTASDAHRPEDVGKGIKILSEIEERTKCNYIDIL